MQPKEKAAAKVAQTAGKKANNTASKRKSTDTPAEESEISKTEKSLNQVQILKSRKMTVM